MFAQDEAYHLKVFLFCQVVVVKRSVDFEVGICKERDDLGQLNIIVHIDTYLDARTGIDLFYCYDALVCLSVGEIHEERGEISEGEVSHVRVVSGLEKSYG